ncbi:hypothetical protein [Dyella subtropica]|uniref:hypothetical protein n=1 Tax=Dyella subtropica TaxID=2992127 RepID=UPI00225781D4|nr:hypothetical protein [Dyella subtropica]
MHRAIKGVAISVIVATSIALSSAALAQATSGQMIINNMMTGWGADSFAIQTYGYTPVNPANCPSSDYYQVDGIDGGYKTLYAAALIAYTNRTPVYIVVSNTDCRNTRPKIIGITLAK